MGGDHDEKPLRGGVGDTGRRSLIVAVIGAFVLSLVLAGTALGSWYWYTSSGLYASIAKDDSRNSGVYVGYNGEMTNATTGTRKYVGIQLSGGGGLQWDSAPDGNPRLRRKGYGGTYTGKHYCINGSTGPVNAKCGWNT